MNISQLQPPSETSPQCVSRQAAEVDADFLALRLLNKRGRVRLSPEPFDLDAIPSQGRLFAVANTKGWFAAAIREQSGYSIVCSPLSQLHDTFSTSNDGETSLQPKSKNSLPDIPTILVFADNDTRLLVGFAQGSIIVYDTLDVFSGNGESLSPCQSITGAPNTLRDLCPNPGDMPGIVAILREVAPGSDSLAVELRDVRTLQSVGGWRRGELPNTIPSALSWSAKGKQIAVGLLSGDIVTYSPQATATPKTIIPRPPSATGLRLMSLTWLSNHEFHAIYGPPNLSAPDIEQTHLIIVFDSKANTMQDIKLVTPYLPFPGIRSPGSFTTVLRNWDHAKLLLFIGDSTSSDIGVIGSKAEASPAADTWYNFTLEETSTPSVPLDKDMNDTVLLGLAQDLTANQSVRYIGPSGEETDVPPSPIMYAYASDGTVIGWHVLNTQGVAYSGMISSVATVDRSQSQSSTNTQPMNSDAISRSVSAQMIDDTMNDGSNTPFQMPGFQQPNSIPTGVPNTTAPSSAPAPLSTGGFGAFSGSAAPFGQVGPGSNASAIRSSSPPLPSPAASDDGMASDTDGFGGLSLGGASKPQGGGASSGGLFGNPPPAASSNNAFASSSAFGSGALKPATGFGAFGSTGESAFLKPQTPTTTSKFGSAEWASALSQAKTSTTSPFGQSGFGKSGFGQSTFGQPAFGQSAATPVEAKPATGFGKFASQPSAFNTFGQTTFGTSAFGQAATSTPSASPTATSAQPTNPKTATFGQSTFGQSSIPSSSAVPSGSGGFGAFAATPVSFASVASTSNTKPIWSVSKPDDEKKPEVDNAGGNAIEGDQSKSVTAASTSSTLALPATSSTEAPKVVPSLPAAATPATTPLSNASPSKTAPDTPTSSPSTSAFANLTTTPSAFSNLTTTPSAFSSATTTPSAFSNLTTTPSAFSNLTTTPSAFSNLTTTPSGFGGVSPGFGAFGNKTDTPSPFSKQPEAAPPPVSAFASSQSSDSSPSPRFGSSSPLGPPKSAFGPQSTMPTPSTPTSSSSGGFAAFSGSSAFGASSTPSGSGKSFGDLLRDAGGAAEQAKPRVSAFKSAFSTPTAESSSSARETPDAESSKAAEKSSDEHGADDGDEGQGDHAEVEDDDAVSFLSETFSDESGSEYVPGQSDHEDDDSAPLSPDFLAAAFAEDAASDEPAALALVAPEPKATVAPSPLLSAGASKTPEDVKPVFTRESSTTPPGTPAKPAVPAATPSPGTSGTPSPPFGLGLGRPTSRPARSSPLASAPINGDDDDVPAKPSIFSKPLVFDSDTKPAASSTLPGAAAPPAVAADNSKPSSPFSKPPVGSASFDSLKPKSPATTGTESDILKPARSKTPPLLSTLGQTPPPFSAPFSLPPFSTTPSVPARVPDGKASFVPITPTTPTPSFAAGPSTTPASLGGPFTSPGGFFGQPKAQTGPASAGPSGLFPSTQPATPTPTGRPSVFGAPAPVLPTALKPERVEDGMQAECAQLYTTLTADLAQLRLLAAEAAEKKRMFYESRGGAHGAGDLRAAGSWAVSDVKAFEGVLQTLDAGVGTCRELTAAHVASVRELESSLLKASTRKEEIVRFGAASRDADFAKVLEARSLGPEHMEAQSQLRRDIRTIRERVQQLEDHIQASKKMLAHMQSGKAVFRPPSLDTVNRTYRNIDVAIAQQECSVGQLAAEVAKMNLGGSRKTGRDKRLPERASVPAAPPTPHVAVSTAAALNAEMSAQRLKRALLAGRTEPLLNTQAVAKPKEASTSAGASAGANLSSSSSSSSWFAPLGASMSIQELKLPEWPAESEEGETEGAAVAARHRPGGSKLHAKAVPLKKSTGTTSATVGPPAGFSWGPLPGVVQKGGPVAGGPSQFIPFKSFGTA